MTAEAVFHLPEGIGVSIEQLGVEVERSGGGMELIVKREVAAGGRGRVLINGSPLAVRDLATAMDSVLEIHGQHESHHRVAAQGYRELLDEFGGNALLLDAARAAFRQWREAAGQLRDLTDAQRDRALKLDLLKYQIDEISAAKLDPPEEDSLRAERSILANARELAEASSGAFSLVDDDESSALAQLARAAHLLQPLAGEIAEV